MTDLDCCGKTAEDWDVLGPVDGDKQDPAGRLRGVEAVGRVEVEGSDGGREDVKHLSVHVQGVEGGGWRGRALALLQGLFEMVQ